MYTDTEIKFNIHQTYRRNNKKYNSIYNSIYIHLSYIFTAVHISYNPHTQKKKKKNRSQELEIPLHDEKFHAKSMDTL